MVPLGPAGHRTERERGAIFPDLPAGYPRDHPAADLLVLKDQMFTARLSDADVLSPRLPDTLADLYAAAGPVWALMARVATA